MHEGHHLHVLRETLKVTGCLANEEKEAEMQEFGIRRIRAKVVRLSAKLGDSFG